MAPKRNCNACQNKNISEQNQIQPMIDAANQIVITPPNINIFSLIERPIGQINHPIILNFDDDFELKKIMQELFKTIPPEYYEKASKSKNYAPKLNYINSIRQHHKGINLQINIPDYVDDIHKLNIFLPYIDKNSLIKKKLDEIDADIRNLTCIYNKNTKQQFANYIEFAKYLFQQYLIHNKLKGSTKQKTKLA